MYNFLIYEIMFQGCYFQECLKLVSRVFKFSYKGVSGVSFESVSRVEKVSFMGVSIVFIFIHVITATRACGGLVVCIICIKAIAASQA